MSYSTKFAILPKLKEERITITSIADANDKDYFDSPKVKVLTTSDNLKKNQVNTGGEYGFVKSIVFAYNHHHSVVIRPDDIWIAILTQFSLYINGNAEKYRNKFVNFDGEKDLKIPIGPGESMKSIPWLIKKFTELINENIVDPELRNWILPDFSTTTENDKIVCGIQMMSATMAYFNYRMGHICGIPSVTLEGTLDDWKIILEKIEKLREYDLDKWVDMLKPVLVQFVNAKNGQFDKLFWKKICQFNSPEMCGWEDLTTTISGWITAFCPFKKDGEWNKDLSKKTIKNKSPWMKLDYHEIPSGRSSVFVTLDGGSKSYDTEFVSGHFGFDVLPDKKSLQPRAGWYTALVEGNKRKYGDISDNDVKKSVKKSKKN